MKKSNLKSIISLLFIGLLLTVFIPTDMLAQRQQKPNKKKSETRPSTNKGKSKSVKKQQAATPVKHYSKQPKRGATVAILPQRTVIIKHHNSNYHYRDGIFYRPLNGNYTVVAPPVGIHVSMLPPNPYQVILTGHAYYYYYGSYYIPLQNGAGYEVVAPPLGAKVDALPDGYEVFDLEGMIYYRLDETYYKAVLEPNGYVAYEVVRISVD